MIKSYDRFLQENYQKNSNQVLNLITRARDELSTELKKLEKEYLEYRQQSTGHPTGEDGKTFIARRLDQWDQAISQAMLRSLNLKSQLELGRNLADDGAGVDVVMNALGHVGGTPLDPAAADHRALRTGLSYDRVEAQLRRDHIPAQDRREPARTPPGRTCQGGFRHESERNDVIHGVLRDPASRRARQRLINSPWRLTTRAKRVSRQANDPSVTSARKRVKDLEAELGRSWAENEARGPGQVGARRCRPNPSSRERPWCPKGQGGLPQGTAGRVQGSSDW